MLEPSVNKVAQVLQPLTDISNLRRLDDNEVRAAARIILDRRNARLSKANVLDNNPRFFGEHSSNTDLVPLPPTSAIDSSVQ